FSAITGAAVDFEQKVFLHQRTPEPVTTEVDVPWNGLQEYRMVVVSADGRYAIALERLQNPIPLAVAKLDGRPLRWRPCVTSIAGTVAGHVVKDHYVAVTDVDAPRGRVVAIALDADNPNDPSCWQEIVPESSATLRTLTPVGALLYLTEFVETY